MGQARKETGILLGKMCTDTRYFYIVLLKVTHDQFFNCVLHSDSIKELTNLVVAFFISVVARFSFIYTNTLKQMCNKEKQLQVSRGTNMKSKDIKLKTFLFPSLLVLFPFRTQIKFTIDNLQSFLKLRMPKESTGKR